MGGGGITESLESIFRLKHPLRGRRLAYCVHFRFMFNFLLLERLRPLFFL